VILARVICGSVILAGDDCDETAEPVTVFSPSRVFGKSVISVRPDASVIRGV
jgi:hypothetical protein